jgi:predicted nucleotidyltransferase
MRTSFSIEELKGELLKRLLPLKPYKIILFGSYAWGKPTKDSDIDLYIVTNDDFEPTSWKSATQIALKYRRALEDLRAFIPMDIIVHTRKQYQKALELGMGFMRKILTEGYILYDEEKSH